MDKRTLSVSVFFLLFAAAAAYAQYPSAEYAIKEAWWRIDALTKLFLCAAWGIVAGVLSLVVIVSGVRYLAEKDLEDRVRARKTVINAFIGLLVIVAACPFVNYLVHGTDVAEFKCDCIPLPPPTTTSTTTTTIPIGAPGTRPTTTTSTTTTTTTRVTTTTKPTGGRFLLIGHHKFYQYKDAPYKPNEMYGVIFNGDGSTYRPQFYIDTDKGPITMAVGRDRFFIAYGSNAMVMDWNGGVKSKITTMDKHIPVKVVHGGDRFYLLLCHNSGGCWLQVYSPDGILENSYRLDIDRIGRAREYLVWGASPDVHVIVPEGDMAIYKDRLFIVWWSETENKVYGIIYNTQGGKVRDRFTVKDNVEAVCRQRMNVYATGASGVGVGSGYSYPFCTLDLIYVNPTIEAGSENFLVMFNGHMLLYDTASGQLKQEKTYRFNISLSMVAYDPVTEPGCIHDIVYGDGRFLAVRANDGIFLDEEGNEVGNGTFGGHSDSLTELAYGSGKFAGVFGTHAADEGIGASFLDEKGNHLIDVMAIHMMAESPGYIAYDW